MVLGCHCLFPVLPLESPSVGAAATLRSLATAKQAAIEALNANSVC